MEVITMQSEAYHNLIQSINEIKEQISNQSAQSYKNKWLNIQETCKFLNVSIRTLQSYRDKVIIPFSQVDGKIYFKVADLEEHLNNHYVRPFNQKSSKKK